MAPSCEDDGCHGAADAHHHSAQRPKKRVVEELRRATGHVANAAQRGPEPPSPGVVVLSLVLPLLEQGDDSVDAMALSFASGGRVGEDGGGVCSRITEDLIVPLRCEIGSKLWT